MVNKKHNDGKTYGDHEKLTKAQEEDLKIQGESSPQYQLQDGPEEVKVEQEFDKDGRLKQPKDVKQPLKVGNDVTDKEQHEQAEKAGTSGVQVHNQGK